MRIGVPIAATLLALGIQAAAPAALEAPHGRQGASRTASRQQAQPPQAPPQPAQPQPQPAQPQQAPPQQSAQSPADQQPPPRIRTGINYVSVDVIVTDKDGQPVLDLKQDDFAVFEDGKPQKVDAFSVVKIDALAAADGVPPRMIKTDFDEEREAVRPDVRLFVILLDDYHVRRGNDLAVRKPLISFLQDQLAPADMVAIMYPLTPITDLRFSRDRESAISAIEKFEGRKFIYTPRNTFEERYAMYPATTVERIRNQISMDALKGAAVKLGGLREGRKSIIYVSEGFTSMLPSQLQDPVASMPGYGNRNRGNAGAPQATDMQNLMASVDLISDMEQVISALNRQNTSIYAVDPRGLAVFEYGVNEAVGLQQDANNLRSSVDTLQVLSTNTDGRAIVSRNDLATGMKQIIRDSSGYYLLGYNSSQAPTDGKFHGIKVVVKRKGIDVRARKGYWAYTMDDVARANAPTRVEAPSVVSTALNELATPKRDRFAHFWIGMSRGEQGSTHVTFVWEAVPRTPGQREEEPVGRVSLTAIAGGRQVYRGRVPDKPAAPAEKSPTGAAAGGATAFDVPPGRIELRMVIEGTNGQVIDAVARELTIPDFTTVQVAFATPQVFRVRTVPELQALKAKGDAVPTSDREFSRSDRLFIRAQAYAPGGVIPAVTARLLNRAGKPMTDLQLQTPAGRGAEIDLPLSALAAGEYLVEIDATTDSGKAQELIAFRVGR